MSIADLGDLEAISVKIQELAKCTKLDKDPEELDELKRLIKKNVPFTLRGYFSAYLLRELLTNNKSKANSKSSRKNVEGRFQTTFTEKQKAVKPASTSENKENREEHTDGKTLYLNIGKIKHLYAKDLAKLLQNELGITREDIYFLKVHDKYSFITMNEENCNKAIERLNGKEINGRVAQINFSNKKRETKEESEQETAANE